MLDLDAVNIKALRQFDQSLLALNHGNSHFRLECRAVVPARSVISALAASCCCCAENPPIPAVQVSRTTSVFPNGGPVERMLLGVSRKTPASQRDRTIQQANVKRFHHNSHNQLRAHLADLLAADTFARRLKRLNGLMPYEYIREIWRSAPEQFILNPIHQIPGLTS